MTQETDARTRAALRGVSPPLFATRRPPPTKKPPLGALPRYHIVGSWGTARVSSVPGTVTYASPGTGGVYVTDPNGEFVRFYDLPVSFRERVLFLLGRWGGR